MTSKNYFTIAGIFLILFILTSIADIFSLPVWIHWLTTIGLAVFAFLGLNKKKEEAKKEEKK
tara:strand:- start:56 stop:241 length:186 start_codon:yes stop_codon:yes gene_type:complete